MPNDHKDNEDFLRNVKKKLTLFFPEDAYTLTKHDIEEGLEHGTFLTRPHEILPLVQTSLIDDKVLEIETDNLTRTYFSRLYDDLPALEEVEENGEIISKEPDYTAGDYLKLMNHLICLPVEPAMGNLQVRNSHKITLRMFTSNMALELGTFFQDLATVRNLPVLRLAFPVIARQIKGSRAYRAKVTTKMDFAIYIKGNKKRPDIATNPIDISHNGMSFRITKEEQDLLMVDDTLNIEMLLSGELLCKVTGNVRHVSKIREKTGIQYRCGVQFDLPTRAIAATIENLVANVQRIHLQELASKSEESGIFLLQ